MLAVVPYYFAAVKPATEQPRQTKISTKSKKRASGSSTAGFGSRKKEPVWQCVNNCGACCKLDKGPSFPSPEEIFDEPSDIQGLMGGAYILRKAQEHAPFMMIDHTFVELSQMFLKTYMGLTRKSSTRKLAVAA